MPDIPIAVSKLPEYQIASQVRYLSSSYPAKYSEYMKRILHCIRFEQPICIDLLYKRMAPLWNRQIASSYVRDRVNEHLEKMQDVVIAIHGYYTLVNFTEVKAPEGYGLVTERYRFRIGSDFTISGTLKLVNSRTSTPYSKTGDNQNLGLWVAIAAASLLSACAAGAFLVIRKRKNKS